MMRRVLRQDGIVSEVNSWDVSEGDRQDALGNDLWVTFRSQASGWWFERQCGMERRRGNVAKLVPAVLQSPI